LVCRNPDPEAALSTETREARQSLGVSYAPKRNDRGLLDVRIATGEGHLDQWLDRRS
jgi:hypothetical protein